jgi:tetratricopeptide (TPR) repeat protein
MRITYRATCGFRVDIHGGGKGLVAFTVARSLSRDGRHRVAGTRSMMAVESTTLVSPPYVDSVLICGRVLREIRRQAGLRLVDLAGGRAAIARLSRLERQSACRLAAPFLNHLLKALHIGAIFTTLEAWHGAIVAHAITWHTRGDPRAVRRTVTALGLILAPCPPEARLLAEIFAMQSAEPQTAGGTGATMRGLSQRAEREAAWPAAAWAYLFESEAHEARGDHEAALAAAMGAVGIPQTAGTALPLLCLGASAARAFARCGRPADGLVILEGVPIGVSHPFAAAQLARAAALLHQAGGARGRAASCLERAADAATIIPNPALGAEIRQDLALLYARDGLPDLASTERLRAAALSRRAGHVDSALALIDAALGIG